jgi:hypothetical protein
MSTSNLQIVRDRVLAEGHGVYLDAVKNLVAAIDEHLENGDNQPVHDPTLQEKATALEAEVKSLQEQLVVLKAAQPVPHVGVFEAPFEAPVKEPTFDHKN